MNVNMYTKVHFAPRVCSGKIRTTIDSFVSERNEDSTYSHRRWQSEETERLKLRPGSSRAA